MRLSKGITRFRSLDTFQSVSVSGLLCNGSVTVGVNQKDKKDEECFHYYPAYSHRRILTST